MFGRVFNLLVLLGLTITPVLAEQSNWRAVTIDNDILVGEDNGYTNGIHYSWFTVRTNDQLLQPDWMTSPLRWSIDIDSANASIQTYSLGQIMVTPEDITLEDPPADDIPYSGALLFNSTLISIHETIADAVGTVVGIVGPSSGAEETQKWFHDLIGADEPKGWHTQLEDEIVFMFSRGRVWRTWRRPDDDMDLLLLGEAGLGTLGSFVASGVLARYGRDLTTTFATPLLINTRSANPAAINNGWYVYAGLRMEYVFNQIFTDGNTFRESCSIDYEKSQLGLTAGLAYSWDDVSVTFALYESNILDESIRKLTRFGTFTFGWRY